MTRRAGLMWALLVVAVGLGVVATTCGREEEPAPTRSSPARNAADESDAVESRPASSAGRRRASRAEARATAPVGDGSISALPSKDASGSTASSPLDALIHVTVTRSGLPLADADVWLLPVVPPELAPDPFAHSAGAYFGVPRYLGLWDAYQPIDGPDRLPATVGHFRQKTDEHGRAELRVRPDLAYTLAVTLASDRLVVAPRLEVHGTAGSTQELAVEANEARRIRGRCVDPAGEPLPNVWVQAFESGADRPASRLVETDAAGAFAFDVPVDASTFRVRAVAKRSGPRFVLVDPGAAPPPIPSDTTVSGVSPSPEEVVIRMAPTPVVLLEVDGEIPVSHLQLEGLVWDKDAAAWGRLGGPAYGGSAGLDPKHALVAIPRADAERPFCVWSWSGPMLSAVDPRGRDRVSVTLRRGRKVVVRGNGWLAGDLVRVVCRTGPPGGEMPVIWTEENPTAPGEWTRGDVPPCAVEFRILRGRREVGTPARVPAGAESIDEVRLDM